MILKLPAQWLLYLLLIITWQTDTKHHYLKKLLHYFSLDTACNIWEKHFLSWTCVLNINHCVTQHHGLVYKNKTSSVNMAWHLILSSLFNFQIWGICDSSHFSTVQTLSSSLKSNEKKYTVYFQGLNKYLIGIFQNGSSPPAGTLSVLFEENNNFSFYS